MALIPHRLVCSFALTNNHHIWLHFRTGSNSLLISSSETSINIFDINHLYFMIKWKFILSINCPFWYLNYILRAAVLLLILQLKVWNSRFQVSHVRRCLFIDVLILKRSIKGPGCRYRTRGDWWQNVALVSAICSRWHIMISTCLI